MAEQSNPGKKALSIGILLALASGGLGAYTYTNVEKVDLDTEITAAQVKEGALVEQAKQLKAVLAEKRILADYAPKGVMIGSKPRVTPFLFPPEVWQISMDKKKENVMLDIYDASSPNIHEPIPNLWFVENGLVEELGLSDGADIDSDEDGFTNGEEYAGKTSPADAAAYPALVSAAGPVKLQVSKIVTSRAVITTDMSLAYTTEIPEEVAVKIYAKPSDTSPISKYTLKKGDQFGVSDKDPKRFTVDAFGLKEFNDMGQTTTEVTVTVTDGAAAEGSNQFVIRAGKPKASEKVEANIKGLQIKDTVVTFEVLAGSEKGKDSASFKTGSENTFTLPGGDKTQYKIQSIEKDGSVKIIKDGDASSTPISVPKA